MPKKREKNERGKGKKTVEKDNILQKKKKRVKKEKTKRKKVIDPLKIYT